MQTEKPFTMRDVPAEGLRSVYPAIEMHPGFIGRVEGLNPACRNFNGSICQVGHRVVMAYRSEAYTAINTIWVAELNSELAPICVRQVMIPQEPGQHYEDPRLAMVGGLLHLMVADVRFGIPNTCQQRLFVLDEAYQPIQEIVLPYGNTDAIEKNWCPFELPDGRLGIVYGQRPHYVIEHATRSGFNTPGAVQWAHGKSLNGRTPPLRLNEHYYLSFFGGHVKHEYRGTRYFMGAQLFRAEVPYTVAYATPAPLLWGSEYSPTILSSRPGSGHPCCVFPAGIIRHGGGGVIVSMGVNDSYIALVRFSLNDLMAATEPLNERGEFC